MDLSSCSIAKLAARLDRSDDETGAAQAPWPTSPDIASLFHLAQQIRSLPPVAPDPLWLSASKRRLLARFERAHAVGRKDLHARSPGPQPGRSSP